MRTSILSLTAAASLGLVACIPPNDDPHPVSRVLPTADEMRVDLPEQAAKKGEANAVGELSPWYVVTRNVTRDLNGGTAWVLILVHTIVQFPATTIEGDTYTWGPWDGDALQPARYRLVVTELSDGTYDWSLDGQRKNAGTDFETVIAGNAVPGEIEGRGHGQFTIDFDAGERVNPVDNDARGVVSIAYDLAAAHLDMVISTVEDRGGVEVPVDYEYAYTRAEDGGGDMIFAAHADTEDEGALAEDAVIRSRWLGTGAGRADVRLSSGDLADAQVTASECWDGSFNTAYYTDSASFLPTEGDPSACAFLDTDLPPL